MPYQTVRQAIGRFSFQSILIAAFVILIVGSASLTGYLSFRNSQAAVDNLAGQLQNEITGRVQQHLERYLSLPPLINQLNLDAIALGQVDLQDTAGLERHFYSQIRRFEQVNSIAYASEQGVYVGPYRTELERSINLGVAGPATGNALEAYTLDEQGNRLQRTATYPDYDPRSRPWYQTAVAQGGAGWTPIFAWTANQIGTDAVVPVYDEMGNLQGVLDVSITLEGINDFLKGLDVGERGEIFVMERSGMMVASSTGESPYRKVGDQAQRLSAEESQIPLIRLTAGHLRNQTGGIEGTHTAAQSFQLEVAGESYFMQVTPFQDGNGLEWLIVTALAEADLMESIHAHNRMTTLLIIGLLLAAVVVAVAVGRWITQPVLHLNRTAGALAQGQWSQRVALQRSDEVGELAASFNRMADELQHTFDALQARQRFLGILNDITGDALRTADYRAMLQTLADRSAELLNADDATLTLWNEATRATIPVATSAAELQDVYAADPAEPDEVTMTATVLQSGQPLAVDDLPHSPYFIPTLAAHLPLASMLALPLIAGQQKLGAVLIAFRQPHHFTAEEIMRGEQAAQLIALALSKAKLLNELEQRVAERTHALTEANEQLRELDQRKDELVANVSHELRTPLTNIRLYLGLLDKRGTAELNRYLPILRRETERLTFLIEDLLTLSRLKQGHLQFTPKLSHLDALVDEVLQTHTVRAADKKLQVIHEPNPAAPAVLVDHTQMMEVLTNLVGNAIAYTPPGGRVLCCIQQVEPPHVVLAIANSGVVIPAEDLPYLFDRFYRGRVGQQSGELGSGLGLAICKAIMEWHGGKIEVESSEVEGTTFRIYLPLPSPS
jgi:signal transduction histidine kinase